MNRMFRLLILVPLVLGLGACAHQRHRDQDAYGQYPAAAPGYGQQSQLQTQYGTVRSIELTQGGQRQSVGGGAIAGAIIGGVIGNQMGSGSGRAATTAIGAVGGAIAGDALERDGADRRQVFRVQVRMDQGGEAQFEFQDLSGLRVGDRVRLENGRLYRM